MYDDEGYPCCATCGQRWYFPCDACEECITKEANRQRSGGYCNPEYLTMQHPAIDEAVITGLEALSRFLAPYAEFGRHHGAL